MLASRILSSASRSFAEASTSTYSRVMPQTRVPNETFQTPDFSQKRGFENVIEQFNIPSKSDSTSFGQQSISFDKSTQPNGPRFNPFMTK